MRRISEGDRYISDSYDAEVVNAPLSLDDNLSMLESEAKAALAEAMAKISSSK